jgi:diaminopimelate decarboxylase
MYDLTKEQFYEKTNPFDLLEEFGSPLYVYSEKILRQRCREIKNLTAYPHFQVHYSAKANSNIALLKIVRSEGLFVDAMSPGEIYAETQAGFKPNEIFFIPNNVSSEEFLYASKAGILTSVDSLSQLELLGKTLPGSKVAVRFNPGVGAGHHQKVVTGGKSSKFGVNPEDALEVKKINAKFSLKMVGINQHIGSLFMESAPFIQSVQSLLSIATHFENLEFVDFGGGFGIPYHKQEGQNRLDLKELGEKFTTLLYQWVKDYGKELTFKIEPGRYIPAECGVLLGRVYAIKANGQKKFAGTDIGFNTLMRPVMYDSYHDIEVYSRRNPPSDRQEKITIVGNICESGDIITSDRLMPEISEGDVLGVLDVGSYGYAMSSTYNNRLRPAEVLIQEDGKPLLIRKRDSFEDLLKNQLF